MFTTDGARANIPGMSYLYLAEDPYTACSEIHPANHQFVSLAEFELLKESKLFDLKTNRSVPVDIEVINELQISPAVLMTAIMNHFATPAIDGSIYRTTQYLSDYIRKAGYDGIRFQSSTSGGTNITLFNSHRSRIKYLESRVVLVHSSHYNIVDLNNNILFDPPVDDGWQESFFEEAKEELKSIIRSAH